MATLTWVLKRVLFFWLTAIRCPDVRSLRSWRDSWAGERRRGRLIPSNLVPRAHVPFGQHQDKEIWRLEIKVDVDTFHKGIQYALGKLGNWKQMTRRLWERACWLFQSSVSWCWPKGTWALGTRLYSLASEGIGRDQYGSLPKQKHSSAKSPQLRRLRCTVKKNKGLYYPNMTQSVKQQLN